MTQLAGSPPPGVQPDNVEAPIQELEVRDCCDLWECCVRVNVIVTCDCTIYVSLPLAKLLYTEKIKIHSIQQHASNVKYQEYIHLHTEQDNHKLPCNEYPNHVGGCDKRVQLNLSHTMEIFFLVGLSMVFIPTKCN